MNWWLLLLPLIGAAVGWSLVYLLLQSLFRPLHPKKIAGFILHGFIPKKQPELSIKLGAFAASVFAVNTIAEKITHPDNVKKIMPYAADHIDHFLRVKLVKSMPVVGMMVGDKTINSLKSLFMDELEALFPVIMQNYLDGLQQDVNIQEIVSARLMTLSPQHLEHVFIESTRRERRIAYVLGSLGGFVIGLIQLLIMHLIVH